MAERESMKPNNDWQRERVLKLTTNGRERERVSLLSHLKWRGTLLPHPSMSLMALFTSISVANLGNHQTKALDVTNPSSLTTLR